MLTALADSYKMSHYLQYPPGTTRIMSYFEARSDKKHPYVVWTGIDDLVHYLMKNLDTFFSFEDLDLSKKLWVKHMGCFNPGFKDLQDLEHLPLKIRALPDGTVAPISVPLLTIENTDDRFPWLTNWMETVLVQLWYPCTVATNSQRIYLKLLRSLEETGCEFPGEVVKFMLHDFGFRGSTTSESALVGGTAHLLAGFYGSDTFVAVRSISEESDNKDYCPAFSIPAMEHSTVTSWGEENEFLAFRSFIEKFPDTQMLACVSDSWDIERACKQGWAGELKDLVMSRKGTIVVRPDSGYPPEMIVKVLGWLWEGYKEHGTVNSKGFKVLPSQIRVIYGDGINPGIFDEIIQNMISHSFAMENVAFGMGSGLLQDVRRDDLGFAMKCCEITRHGVTYPVFKKPKSDTSKASKPGKLTTISKRDGTDMKSHDLNYPIPEEYVDRMITYFDNGKIPESPSFESRRINVKLTAEKLL